jgi:heptose I phosphotransferase
MVETETLDQGRLTVATEFLPLLRADGLDSFDKVMALEGGKVARDFPGRRTVHVALKGPDGAAVGVFLKRYQPEYLATGRKLLRLLHWPGAQDEALQEWRAIQNVRAVGIATATPIAVGQKKVGGLVASSFLMTLEIAGAIEGHLYAEGLEVMARRRFLLDVAEMARRFHAAGFVHKDFYLAHVLVAASEPRLFLIDLQRVIKPCCLRDRWLAKDLGALAYSMFNAGATYTDLMRAFLAYCGESELDASRKQFARKIFRRVAWLRTRQPKHDGLVRQRV